MVRAMYRTLRWLAATPGTEVARVRRRLPRRRHRFSPPLIDRYRALSLYGSDPVTRREGVERLQAAMRSGGALDRDIPFEDVVDNSLAEEAVANGVGP